MVNLTWLLHFLTVYITYYYSGHEVTYREIWYNGNVGPLALAYFGTGSWIVVMAIALLFTLKWRTRTIEFYEAYKQGMDKYYSKYLERVKKELGLSK